jgi:hypothetical protein
VRFSESAARSQQTSSPRRRLAQWSPPCNLPSWRRVAGPAGRSSSAIPLRIRSSTIALARFCGLSDLKIDLRFGTAPVEESSPIFAIARTGTFPGSATMVWLPDRARWEISPKGHQSQRRDQKRGSTSRSTNCLIDRFSLPPKLLDPTLGKKLKH